MKEPVLRIDLPARNDVFDIHPSVVTVLEPVTREVSAALALLNDAFAATKSHARARVEALSSRARGTGDVEAANHEIQALRSQVDQASATLLEAERALEVRVAYAEVSALAVRDRDRLRDERARASARRAELRRKYAHAEKQEDLLAQHLAERKAAARRAAERSTSSEHEAAELRAAITLHSKAAERTLVIGAALAHVEREYKKLTAGWCLLRERERDHRVAERGRPPQYCRGCEAALDDCTLMCCSHKCQRRAAIGIKGRRCAGCGRRFESSTRRVRVLDEIATSPWGDATPYEVDCCSLDCWSALIVDEDEPPSFDPATTYIGPARRGRQARQAVTAGASPMPHAVKDTGDRVAELLRQAPEGLTVTEILAQSDFARTTVQSALAKLAREGRVIGEGRGGRWRLTTTTTK